jgi:hypothetical protein
LPPNYGSSSFEFITKIAATSELGTTHQTVKMEMGMAVKLEYGDNVVLK